MFLTVHALMLGKRGQWQSRKLTIEELETSVKELIERVDALESFLEETAGVEDTTDSSEEEEMEEDFE